MPTFRGHPTSTLGRAFYPRVCGVALWRSLVCRFGMWVWPAVFASDIDQCFSPVTLACGSGLWRPVKPAGAGDFAANGDVVAYLKPYTMLTEGRDG